MSVDSNAPIDDTVSSVSEFGIGAILRLIMIVIAIGTVLLMVSGDTEVSAEALLIGGVVFAGLFFGNIVVSLI